MHWQVQMAHQNFLFDTLFQCFRVAKNAQLGCPEAGRCGVYRVER